jgi:hypothetical protein
MKALELSLYIMVFIAAITASVVLGLLISGVF